MSDYQSIINLLYLKPLECDFYLQMVDKKQNINTSKITDGLFYSKNNDLFIQMTGKDKEYKVMIGRVTDMLTVFLIHIVEGVDFGDKYMFIKAVMRIPF